MKNWSIVLSLGLLVIICCISCDSATYKDGWEVTFEGLGSSSSPKATDLNGDGVLDIIIGAGGKEFTATEFGVIALNGIDGSLLWKVATRNQVIGTPLLFDFNKDGIKDVLIGGRSGILNLIDGITGGIIWNFIDDDPTYDIISDISFLNFYNVQLTPDINHDGEQDILASFGGYTKACPTCLDRPGGHLLLISSENGKEILRMPMPDKKEIYMSPILVDLKDGEGLRVIFGTGGERIGGHLYTIKFDDLVKLRYNKVSVLMSDDEKGFIAPPVIIDIDDDGVLDIIINSVNGKISCISGQTKRELWNQILGDGFEGYAMSSVGDYDGDGKMEIFCTYGFGAWPLTKYTRNVVLSGIDGNIEYSDSTGTIQYASPVSYDFTGDGIEDVLLATNNPITTRFQGGHGEVVFLGNELRVYNIVNKEIQFLRPSRVGTNLGSTPLITDLDNDGNLDIISCYMTDSQNFYSFSKMAIERLELKLYKKAPFNWNGYMGVNTNGIDVTTQ